MFKNVHISTLRVGDAVVLASPIRDNAGTKLVGAGIAITQRMVELLQERGVQGVVVDEQDLARITSPSQPFANGVGAVTASVDDVPAAAANPAVAKTTVRAAPLPAPPAFARPRRSVAETLNNEITEGANLRALPTGIPYSDAVVDHGAAPYHPETVARVVAENQRFIDDLSGFLSAAGQHEASDLGAVDDISRGSLSQLAADTDATLALAIQDSLAADARQRSLNVSKLAVSIGITTGYDRSTLIELSIGCLIHDLGMTHVDASEVCPHTSGKHALRSVVEHPQATLDLLRDLSHEIPRASLLIAYQMHERCNGSGYPNGHKSDHIHDLAKIAAVADMFTALVTPGPGREPLLPYQAMKSILFDVQRGLFDTNVVRAALNTLSICPVGSYVVLSDLRTAQVIRPNREHFKRPIVEICRDAAEFEQSADEPEIVDLSMTDDVEITRAVAAPTACAAAV